MFLCAVKSAAEFFQSYIDTSLGGSSGRRVEGSLATSNAVDITSAYNLLGLALRDSGSDLIATKKAFLAGLSVAPDDLALLVNGGVAHQVRVYVAQTSQQVEVEVHVGSLTSYVSPWCT